MDKIISILKRPAKMVIWISLAAFGVFYLLAVIGGMAGSDIGGIFGGLFQIIVILAVVGGYVTAAILKKDNVTRILGAAMLAYYIVAEMMSFGGVSFASTTGAWVAYNVLYLIALVALAASVVVYLIGVFFGEKKTGGILKVIALGGLGLYTLMNLIANFVLFVIPGIGWVSVMSVLSGICVLPAVVLGYLLICMPNAPVEPAGENNAPEPEEVIEPEVVDPEQ